MNHHKNQAKKKILFVSHDASRTGAPIVLMNFLLWLKGQDCFEFYIYLKDNGVLIDDFKSINTTFTRYYNHKGRFERVWERFASKLGKPVKTYILPPELEKLSFDLVYLNTVASLDIAPYLKKVFNCPIICHIHENDFTIKNYFHECMAFENLTVVDQFIAVSKSTAENMMLKYNISTSKIALVCEPVPQNKIRTITVSKEEIKTGLGLKNEFIVGGSGLTSWRKGVDMFVRLAVVLNELEPDNDIKLIWVGAVSHEFKNQFAYESERLGVAGKIIFTGVKETPQNYFQLFDLFALTSREDPFPLVALEAASLKKAIVCFDNTGGIPELIEDGKSGIIIPYGDVKQMAEAILLLSKKSEKLQAIGTAAEELVAQFDMDIIGRQLVEVIENTLS